jgi:hypothetical protein
MATMPATGLFVAGVEIVPVAALVSTRTQPEVVELDLPAELVSVWTQR